MVIKVEETKGYMKLEALMYNPKIVISKVCADAKTAYILQLGDMKINIDCYQYANISEMILRDYNFEIHIVNDHLKEVKYI